MVTSVRRMKLLSLLLMLVIAGCSSNIKASATPEISPSHTNSLAKVAAQQSAPANEPVQLPTPAKAIVQPPAPVNATLSTFSILAVQQQLVRLGIPVGTPDGSDGPRTQNARCSFAYLSGNVSGRQTPTPNDLAALNSTKALTASNIPSRTAPRYVIVDQTCQMAYFVQNHKLAGIYSVSTGRDHSGKHHTLNGEYQVNSKLPGDTYSNKYTDAILHDAMCFTTQGDCLHGYTSVPPYPASHGCVRFSYSDIEKLFPTLNIGDPVIVVGSF